MPSNYVLLEKITISQAGSSSVTFSSIPQTGYTDLVIKASCRSTWNGSTTALALQFNGDGGSNYSYRRFFATGTAAGMDSTATTKLLLGYVNGSNQAANTFSNTEIYIPNYTSSSVKSVSTDSVNEDNVTAAFSSLSGGLWSGTAAITSITLVPWDTPANFVGGTSFYLYGVAKLGTTPVITPYAAGGDTIMTDGTYWYHAFTSSGSFTPTRGLPCEVLTVAGGGGGGGGRGGGGGAGGAFASSVDVTSSQSVTVGTGGTGGTAVAGGGTVGANGTNSQFGSLTAAVGGGGGMGNDTPGVSGSGGSSGGTVLWGGTPGTAVSGQGFIGGRNTVGYTISGAAGGGGGAGAVGGSTSTATAGSGGIGLNTWSSWLSVTGLGVSGYIAGGGGGAPDGANTAGAGGAGGGGAGGSVAAGSNAIANTGGGGGGGGRNSGSGTTYIGGNGGSGLVIVRYPV